jgi:long-chain acyl-CoA synthetase
VSAGAVASLHHSPAEWLSLHAGTSPARIALVDGDARLSYGQLEAVVSQLAASLQGAGVGPGDAVATLMPNSWQMVAVMLAALHRGAVALPVNPQYQASEIETTLGQARPRAIFAAPQLQPFVDGVLARLDAGRVARIGVPEVSSGWLSWLDFLDARATLAPPAECGADRPALWLYSSGSTGGSKKISRTRAALAAEASAFHRTVGTGPADVLLCSVPLSHAHGFGNGLLAAMWVGATLVVHERFDRRRFLASVEAERVTIVPGSPFMFKMLAETKLPREPDLSSIRLCFTAGAPLSREVFEACRARFGLGVRQLYGTTETGAASINLSADLDATWNSVGRPLHGVEIEAFDELGRQLPPGQEGVLGIRSPAMFDGYGNAELDARALRNGWFFPGDRGRLDREGRVAITGRDTLFINLAGNKVDPSEVEAALNAHPKVVESVVLGVRRADGDELVKAVVVAREPCDAAELLAFCRGRIADFKLPRLVEFRDEIPRNPLGKVLRKYLL